MPDGMWTKRERYEIHDLIVKAFESGYGKDRIIDELTVMVEDATELKAER